MKIKGQVPKVPTQDQGIQKGKEKEIARTEDQKTASTEKTSVEQFAVKKLRGKIESEPDVNLQKVKELKEKLKKGEYKVETEKLADNLLKDSLLEDISDS
ncbi:MAG: flagellar biosynthesis anti-sigma factor FlgM [Proteobacteria bacterium]|nr:flagellar biosynthesis anti-sigma factor FlgM [Pseudomonadota bacterium]